MDVRHYCESDRGHFHRINVHYPGLEVVHADPWIFAVRDLDPRSGLPDTRLSAATV